MAGRFLPCLLQLALLLSGFPAAAFDILVPAYGNPCCGGGPAMWSGLIAAASTPGRSFALRVVFNPASGPGTAPDPNYVDANGQGPLPSLHSAGAVVYGYVATGFGTRPTSEILADIDAYLIGHYAGLVDGIFFDELSTDLARVGTSRIYADRVALRSPTAPTIGNPGTPGVLNPSGQTLYSAVDYADVFDLLVTVEDAGLPYRTNYTAPSYLASKPPSGFAHLIHSEGAFDPALLSLAASREAGVLYVTDDLLPNPYDRLPADWAELLAAAAASASQPVPIATPVALGVVLSSLLLTGIGRLRGTSRSGGDPRSDA